MMDDVLLDQRVYLAGALGVFVQRPTEVILQVLRRL
jgi:hypothetical protein